MQLLMAAVKASHTSVQWWTLAWIAGAAVVAAVTIAIIVIVSRRPKSMEDGMAEFSRSLQAVAPAHRSAPRPGREPGHVPAQQKHKKNAPSGQREGRPKVARDLAIDLGTANTLVYAKGHGIVLNEPTVIALDSRTNTVLNMGREAWQMIGRTPGYIVAVRPLRKGAITDFDITQRMIELLLKRAGSRGSAVPGCSYASRPRSPQSKGARSRRRPAQPGRTVSA